MRSLFAPGFATAIAMFVACSSFEDADVADAVDSGTPEATSTNDATGDDGSASADGGANDVEAGPPPGMILVKTSATSFWIDAREVTTAEFSVFKENVVQTDGGDAGLPDICSFKSGTLGPGVNCGGKQPGTAVACVDWCDAFAYCRFAGKRSADGSGAALRCRPSRRRIESRRNGCERAPVRAARTPGHTDPKVMPPHATRWRARPTRSTTAARSPGASAARPACST